MSYLALALGAPLALAAVALIVFFLHLKRSDAAMTKKVHITNADNYPVDVLVTPVCPKTGASSGSQAHRIAPGESCEAYVHGSQVLRIEEAPAAAQVLGGGGPGEER
ncbi:MAG: hypothetical protein YHS30scaffold667_28 [Phage 65_10]|nr:MAG: hypothetical protein YHS30scaffold667_28 [Phage 65_10]